MKVVKILWIDSCASNLNWTIAEDIDVKPMFIETFGVVVKENEEYLAVAQNYGDDPEQYCNIMTIPKGCIKEVFVIHEDDVCENEQNHAWSEAWSEEDDIMKQHCHQMLALLRPNSSELTKDIIDNCHHWLKSIKSRVQPKIEWSEEDERDFDVIRGIIYNSCNAEDASRLIAWLKSLKDRVQPQSQQQWKPSDEQLDSLYDVLNPCDGFNREVLESLYVQLKKLREE